MFEFSNLLNLREVAAVAAYRLRRLSGRAWSHSSAYSHATPAPHYLLGVIIRHFIAIDQMVANDLGSHEFSGIQPYINDAIISIQTLLDNPGSWVSGPIKFPLAESWGYLNHQE